MAKNSPKKSSKKRITFQFHATEADEICLAGNFNGWNPAKQPLKRYKNGNWKTTLTLAPGIYEYRFIVDGSWVDDPQCVERAPNEFGGENCIIRI
jgi:1,4-alpha-glucan branching enzyme